MSDPRNPGRPGPPPQQPPYGQRPQQPPHGQHPHQPGQHPQRPQQPPHGQHPHQPGQYPHQGHPGPYLPAAHGQPIATGAPGQPEQRAYAQPHFAPTVTQEMRLRAQLQPHSGGPVEAPWVTQAIERRPQLADPEGGADIARLIVGVVIAAVLAMALLIMLGLAAVFLPAGPVVIVLAGAPLLFIVLMVWWFDRWKPQPVWLLICCLLWGAVAAVLITFIANIIGGAALGAFGIDASGDVVGAVILAPVFEESAKGIFLVVIVLAARKHFAGPLDGWVYGSLIGAGFAFTENILYFSTSFHEGSVTGLATTFVMRGVLSPLLHSTFVICHGMAIGLAARRGAWWLVVLMWIPGLIAGMFFHALWNGSATLISALDFGDVPAFAIIIALSLLISGFWFISGLLLRRNEAIQTRRSLGDYANAGWLTHGEVDMLGTWKGRRAGKAWAAHFPGARPFMKQLIRKSADLAAIRTRVLAGVGGAHEREVEKYELNRFVEIRKQMMRQTQRQRQIVHPGMQR